MPDIYTNKSAWLLPAYQNQHPFNNDSHTIPSLFRYPPYQRPSAAAALAHAYFSSPPAPAPPDEIAAFAEAALALHARIIAGLAAMSV